MKIIKSDGNRLIAYVKKRDVEILFSMKEFINPNLFKEKSILSGTVNSKGYYRIKDPENIKKIFSEDLINNVNNLNDGINKLINIADEGIADVKVIMNGSQTHFESGNHRKIYKFSLNITTTNNKVYYIRFNYDYENPFNTKTLGVNRMLIMDENNNIILLIENEI